MRRVLALITVTLAAATLVAGCSSTPRARDCDAVADMMRPYQEERLPEVVAALTVAVSANSSQVDVERGRDDVSHLLAEMSAEQLELAGTLSDEELIEALKSLADRYAFAAEQVGKADPNPTAVMAALDRTVGGVPMTASRRRIAELCPA